MEPTVARLKPYLVTLQAGRTYYWCRCGRSKKQPLCDGSHAGTGFEPLKYVAQTEGEEVLFCGCKHTRTPPFCDGSHSNLPGGSPLDDPDSAVNCTVPLVEPAADARTMLDGSCYVFSPSRAQMLTRGTLRYCKAICGELGAFYQTQIYMQAATGFSPTITFGDRHVILFVASGAGAVTISGRRFQVAATDGIHVRPSEAFQLANDASSPLEVFVSACPLGEITWLEHMPGGFDEAFPERVVSVDVNQRTALGPRYFQCLVDKAIGSNVITQFIGHIPQSKAAPHRHLYEEAIIVLAGEGCMWTESRKTRVQAGDVIFLPRKQEHSLQSTTPQGLEVVGVIYPGDNPSINY
jgi:mannose-6-phosphate isomerase-like protein (cupin superfamily)/CDGSH-type Zn-finger protein